MGARGGDFRVGAFFNLRTRLEIEHKIESVAQEYLVRRRAPGVAIAVDVGSVGRISLAYGVADARTRAPCRPETRFAVGSITKQFTAAAILLLAAQGRLSLNDVVGDYFDVPKADRRIRVRHLLSHTAGLPLSAERRLRNGAGFGTAPERLLAEALDSEPGARWRYSNAGFAILGRLIERCSNKSYSDFVTTHVIRRAGLQQTTVGPDGIEAAIGHAVSVSGFGTVEQPSHDATFASGSIHSSAPDLLDWNRALSSGEVIDSSAFSLMTTPCLLNSGERSGYGMGLFTATFANSCELSQDGHSGGFSSQLAVYPDVAIAIAVLTNGASHDAEALEKAITRWLMNISAPTVLDLDPPLGEFEDMVGTYEGAASTVIVSLNDGQLFLQTPSGLVSRLMYQGCGVFLQDSDTNVMISLEGAGSLSVSREGRRLAQLSRARA